MSCKRPKFVPPATGPLGRKLGDFLCLGPEGGGEAGRGQLGGLFGGRIVRQAGGAWVLRVSFSIR